MRLFGSFLVILGIGLAGAFASAGESPGAVVADVLDDFHAAAAVADEERYLGHLAPDAVFLGTDASERWTVEEFRAFVHPYFSKGRGWTYVATERHVMLAADGNLAWFDETLGNEKYGKLRGTGVLRKEEGRWKIVHYSMTFLVPNDVAPAVVDVIRSKAASTNP
jgi:ketosteroid isomerase-like protein